MVVSIKVCKIFLLPSHKIVWADFFPGTLAVRKGLGGAAQICVALSDARSEARKLRPTHSNLTDQV